MRGIIALAFCICFVFQGVAQIPIANEGNDRTHTAALETDSTIVPQRTSFGFNFGINYSNMMTQGTLPENAGISNGAGFRMGILMEDSINKYFAFAPKIELSFNDHQVLFKNPEDYVTNYKVSPITLEIMAHVLIKKKLGKFNTYFLFGPNFKIPITADDNTFKQYASKRDLAIDFGIGFDHDLKFFHFAPELRYSYGLINVNQHPNIKSLRCHTLSLVFNFKG